MAQKPEHLILRPGPCRAIKILWPWLAILFVLNAGLAQNFWEPTAPYGAMVRSVGIDPAGTIFMATEIGVYRSPDNGNSWTFSALSSVVNTFAFSGDLSAWAGDRDGRVFRSRDGGNTWVEFSVDTAIVPIRKLLINSTGDIFVAGEGNGIHRSSDEGITWVPVNSGLTSQVIYALAEDGSGVLFAGADSGAFRSFDHGDTWEAVNSGLPDFGFEIRDLAIHPNGGIFAGLSSGAGVYQSMDVGTGWVPANSGLGEASVFHLRINPAGDIFAGGPEGMFRSLDLGNSWTAANAGLPASEIGGLDINSNGDIFAGTIAEGLFRSVTNGENWTEVTAGVRNVDIARVAVNQAGVVLAGGSGGYVYRSLDNGDNWTRIRTGLSTGRIEFLTISPNGAIYTGRLFGEVLQSLDNGNQWTDLQFSGTGQLRAAAANSSEHVFIGSSAGIWQTIDGGTIWEPVNSGLTDLDIFALAISSNGVMLAGSYGGYLYRSTDNGSSWTEVYSGLNGSGGIRAIVIAPNGTMFAGTDLQTMLRSSDNGVTWQALANWPGNFLLTMDVSSDGQIFAGTYGQSYRSTDNGETWENISSGLSGSFVAVAVSPKGYAFAGTFLRGLYRSSQSVLFLQQDSLALVDLYNSTGGPNWINNSNWLTAAPLSTWNGVVVENGRVVSVDLPFNNLAGTLPATIGNLDALSNLELNGNQLSGSIPAEIGKLSRLTVLDLNNNQLSGSIPAEIGNLGSLVDLALGLNQLSGSIPPEIGNLANLTFLFLNGNQLSGSIPAEIGNLSGLADLQIFQNQLSGSIPAEIGKLVNLTTLFLAENQLSGSIPAEIGNLVNLTFLSLASNQLVGEIPPDVGILVNLSQLNLSRNQLVGAVPTGVAGLGQLRELYLDQNQLNELPPLNGLEILETLHIQNNRFTFEDIEPNIDLPLLEFIYAPQANVGVARDTTVTAGSRLTLSVSVGGQNNQYQWLKDGTEIPGAVAPVYGIGPLEAADAGVYTCRITNTIVPDLTLSSEPLTVIVQVPELSLSQTAIDFGLIQTGFQIEQSLTVGNLGPVDLLIDSTILAGPNVGEIIISSGGGPGRLPPGTSRDIGLLFIPEVAGVKSASLLIYSNALSSPDTVTLRGEATNEALAQVSWSTTQLDFGAVVQGSDSLQFLTLTNTGSGDLYISSLSLEGADAGEFQLPGGSAPDTLAFQESREIALRFFPQSLGVKSALLILQSNARSSPDTVSLSGSGVEAPRGQVSLSTTLLDFGSVLVNSFAEQSLTLTNSGAAVLTISETVVTGTDAAEYTLIAGGGGGTLEISASREITVRFSPLSEGDKSAFLIIGSDALSSPDTVNLIGSGGTRRVTVIPGNETPPAGTDYSLTIIPPPDFQANINRLFYRRTGELLYQSSDLLPGNNGFTGNIPSDFLTIRGAEYYVSLSDGQEEITFPEVDPVNRPAVVQVQVARQGSQATFRQESYQMISVPLELSDPGIPAVLGDNYGEYDPHSWRVLHWDENISDYREYPQLEEVFSPGTAFWLITRSGEPFDVQNGRSVSSAEPYVLTLTPGWNQIGNPFAFPVSWSAIENAVLVQAPRKWNSELNSYDPPADVLVPWEGYFVYNLDSLNSVDLFISPVEGSPAKNKNTFPAKNLSENEFVLQLQAKGLRSGSEDRYNYLGMLKEARDGLDRLDFLAPPPVVEGIQLTIQEGRHACDGNFRAISTAGAFWDIRLHTAGISEEVQLTIGDLNNLPPGFQVWLLDKTRQAPLPLAGGEVRLSPAEGRTLRQLRLIAGTEEFALHHSEEIPLVAVEFSLEQNYPNPFNPETSIRYYLAERGTVRLEIYNMLGQRVRTLVNEDQKTGEHRVVWDGRDDRGIAVASGIYLYRLSAGSYISTKKMALIR